MAIRPFLDADFLLHSDAAKQLFHEYAERCPIIDYHNHLATREIFERRKFQNLAQIWLECDHYKWRAMRACGVDERLVTGDAPDYEKFLAWAAVVPQLIGSPLYHWTHIELQRYFGIYEPLTEETAPAIWEKTCELLAGDGFDAVSLLKMQNVEVLCTTDDPIDTLEWHIAIRDDGSFPFRVLPSFRPDRYLTVEANGWKAAVEALGARYSVAIETCADLMKALDLALDHFAASGCKVSDHGMSRFLYAVGDPEPAFKKAMRGETLTDAELAVVKGALFRHLGAAYKARGIAMQLHLGPIRNLSPKLMQAFGPDAGGDTIGYTADPAMLGAYLGDLEGADALPNTVLYNLNPADNAMLSTMAASFAPKVQFGAAWWLNDHIRGMQKQIDELMETSNLAVSVGMLTDSRSFTSFGRHEYYRRILCDKLGALIEDGQYPNDIARVGKIVENICCGNAIRFFGL